MNYTDEEYHQMTVDELFEVEVKPNLFAVSRIFAEAHKQMNLAEYKAFTYALSHIEWTQPCPDTIYLDKKEVAKVVGITSDINHMSEDLKRSIGQMPRHSFIEFDDKGKKFYVSGNFVRTIAMFRNVVRIRIEDEFLSLFGSLGQDRSEVSKYITMWSGDIFRMKSERAVLFYELLRDNSDTREDVNVGTVGIKKFKEMFDIPKDGPGSYMREKGGFDRKNFELYVIDPLCDELSKTEMIRLLLTPDGKPYEKVKHGKRVIGYKFWWTLQNPKARIEEKPKVEDNIKKDKELWVTALEKDGVCEFSDEQMAEIREVLVTIPDNSLPIDTATGMNDIDFRRYHYIAQQYAILNRRAGETKINNRFAYFKKMLQKDASFVRLT